MNKTEKFIAENPEINPAYYAAQAYVHWRNGRNLSGQDFSQSFLGVAKDLPPEDLDEAEIVNGFAFLDL